MKLFLVCVILPVVMAQKCPPAPLDPVTCKDNELTCGGETGPDGCLVPTWCKYIDPYERCSSRAFCETECGPDMMKCAGGMDDDDCPMPDTCVPSKTTDDCPAECPIVCGKNEIPCDYGREEKMDVHRKVGVYRLSQHQNAQWNVASLVIGGTWKRYIVRDQ